MKVLTEFRIQNGSSEAEKKVFFFRLLGDFKGS